MTLDGTNTWILAAPGDSACLVIDPGPDHDAHLRAVLDDAEAAGRRVSAVLLTHGHPDHAEGAARLAELAGAPLRAVDPAHCAGASPLVPGEEVRSGALQVIVVPAAGHTADSVAFLVPEAGLLLTGDTMLGAGWTVVAFPDGQLEAYLQTLDRFGALVSDGAVRTILPGHGPVVGDPAERIAAYREHRRARLEQVRAALASGAQNADDVVATVYADVPVELHPAARLSVQAQLAYLAERSSR